MSKFNDGDLVRHVKTENVYRIVTSDALIEATLTPAYAYKGNHLPHVWVRPQDEMEDGRFVLVESVTHPDPAQAQVSDAMVEAALDVWCNAPITDDSNLPKSLRDRARAALEAAARARLSAPLPDGRS